MSLEFSQDKATLVFDVGGYELHIGQWVEEFNKGTGTAVWDCAKVLAKYVERHKASLRIKSSSCLELGTGCGLAGLAVALLGCPKVTLTDLPILSPLIKANIGHNNDVIARAWREQGYSTEERPTSSVSYRDVDWRDFLVQSKGADEEQIEGSDDGKEVETYDLILGADVVFKEDLALPLLHTIRAHSHSSTRVLLAIELRSQTAYDAFLEQAKLLFNMSKPKFHRQLMA